MCQHRNNLGTSTKASAGGTNASSRQNRSKRNNTHEGEESFMTGWGKKCLIGLCLAGAVVALALAGSISGYAERKDVAFFSWKGKWDNRDLVREGREWLQSSFWGNQEEWSTTGISKSHQFAIVIDGGSTGSRMFVYRFIYPGEGEKREIECITSKKVTPGLSSLDGKANGAAEYLRPLLHHASMVVPLEYQSETLVFIQATAGMRLLSEESQEAIYDAIFSQLGDNPAFPFKLHRSNIGTLSGRLEGYYAALSVNYLTGRMNTHLEPNQAHKEAVIGALDMGGSSTQIVFQHVEDNKMELDESDFWVQSYLAYGVDTIRYRLWSHLTRHVPPDGASTVENPCGFLGHEENFKGHRLIGTGASEECGKQIRQMLWDEEHENCSSDTPCGLDGIRHPPLTGKFLAMSVFFFALDCMKQLGPIELPHWPSPSIDEIEHAAQTFCGQDWGTVNSSGLHAYTRDELLPYRCVEVVYIHTLLKHGYGFPGDSRNVTFVLDIDGMEVEWTLGYALAEVPLENESVDDDVLRETSTHPSTTTAGSAEEQQQSNKKRRSKPQVHSSSSSINNPLGLDINEFVHQGQGLLEMAISDGPVLIVSCFVGIIMAISLVLSLFVKEREQDQRQAAGLKKTK